MVPHNLPMTVLGAALLWFGWFGFNAGSALGANALLPAPSCFAGCRCGSYRHLGCRRNGLSRVTDHPRCRFGLHRRLSCHHTGSWLRRSPPGLDHRRDWRRHLLLRRRYRQSQTRLRRFPRRLRHPRYRRYVGFHRYGHLATTEVNPAGANGLFYGSSDLLVAQIISTVVAYALAIVGTFILFKIISFFMTVRTDKNEEITGLDIGEHGERGYNYAIMSGQPLRAKRRRRRLGNCSFRQCRRQQRRH